MGQRVPLLQEFIAASARYGNGSPPAIASARGGASQQNWVANVRFGSKADIALGCSSTDQGGGKQRAVNSVATYDLNRSRSAR